MTAKEIVEAVLELIGIFVSWPVAIFLIFFLFRSELRRLFPELINRLSRRVTKATIGSSSFEFASAEALAIKDTVEQHSSELPEKVAKILHEQLDKVSDPKPRIGVKLPLMGKSILWIDDNPENNAFEANLLRRFGAQIKMVKTTDEALATRTREQFNLIISDIHRVEDGVDRPQAGYEYLAKNEVMEPYIPVVFYTGNASRVDPVLSAPSYGITDNSRDLVNVVIASVRA